MVEERGGWFVVNVKDANWYEAAGLGQVCSFEKRDEPFPEIGVHLYVIEPGKPNCRYHREEAQEDFLVLSGRCKLLVNGEEKPLRAWDFVHCPAGVTHVLVGDGEGPCVFLAVGHRTPENKLYYPASDLARTYNAETPEPTADPRVAYSDLKGWQPAERPKWPLGPGTD